MTALEERLLELGNKLATAMGHSQTCPKVNRAIPCTCGKGGTQAQALADWLALVQQVKGS